MRPDFVEEAASYGSIVKFLASDVEKIALGGSYPRI